MDFSSLKGKNLLICCLRLSIPRLPHLWLSVKQNFRACWWSCEKVICSHQWIALKLWTSLSSSKKYCGKKMFGSDGKKANVTVLPEGFFWPYEKDTTVSTRESPMLPELNNERRQFNAGPWNPRIKHHCFKSGKILKQIKDLQGIPVCKTAPTSAC